MAPPPKGASTEPTTGSDSAATEHTEEPQLAELVNQGAGQSSVIELKVIRSEIIDYDYTWNGNPVTTQKLQVILQSKIPDQYCVGVVKLQKKDKRAQENCRPLADWHHVEVQSHHSPRRQAGLYSHPMPHRNRSAQVAGSGAATEHGLSTGTSANSYYRRHITIGANAELEQMQRFDLMAIPSASAIMKSRD